MPKTGRRDAQSTDEALSRAEPVVPLLIEPSPERPVVFGSYQLLKRIGAGGMGEVFLAREDGPPPRAVVVKKVLSTLVANRTFVGRFLDEAKVAVRLDHPNIARVFAMGEVAGEFFLAMEYVQGKTVSRFFRRLRERNESVPAGVALYLAEQVCEGLEYAHRATDANHQPLHLVHRDLSPANVCISYRGEVKIIDFGAAQSTLKEEQTAPRVVIGNLTYMAPEQARKRAVDGRADVYSCGVLLWELLAGKMLSQKGDPDERWRRAASPFWDPPSRLQPGLPEELDEAVLTALERDPEERYASAAEFAAALRQARQRHFPGEGAETLAALLSAAFTAEKRDEDDTLLEALSGVEVARPPAQRARPPRSTLAPPTAIAFEHPAAEADGSSPVSASSAGSLVGRTPPARTQPQPGQARAAFGFTSQGFSSVALLQEVKGAPEERPPSPQRASGPGAVRARARPRAAWWDVALYAGIFLVAMAGGFLVVWLVGGEG